MNKMKYLLLIGMLMPFSTIAQTIKGIVLNNKKEALVEANVFWLGSNKGTTTNSQGEFKLALEGSFNKKLVVSYVGYLADTILIVNDNFLQVNLKEAHSITEIKVQKQRDGVIISDLEPIKIEQITTVELAKSACCDLSGCFETQTTVQPQTTNVITNSKELRILGLSGVYNQILIDGLPLIYGLAYTYGISSIPGPMVENIYVAKGANSVLQGFESISGQINVLTKDPSNTKGLFLNSYINSFREKHFNANYSFKKGKWSNITGMQIIQPSNRIDRDKDGFLDLPLLTRYLFSNRWKFGNEKKWGFNSQIGTRFYNEKRIGGQTSFNENSNKGSTTIYGQVIKINQPELWVKLGYRLNDEQNFSVMASSVYQNQQSFFGTTKYNATQKNAYVNLQYEYSYGNNILKSGFSFRHLDLREEIAFTDTFLMRSFAGTYRRKENISGLFTENTMQFFNNTLTWITGLRIDHHNSFGFILTPRTLLKYDISSKTILRGSIGKGWRTVNLFSENIGLLSSSRDIVFKEALLPERAVNYGINLTQRIEPANGFFSGYVSIDYYRTHFQNQIFPDFDTNPRQAIIQNFQGTSVSNAFQLEVFLKIKEEFEIKSGYNYLEVYRRIGQVKQLLPFNAMHKFLTSLSYKPMSNKYHLDINIHWYGAQRLPDTRLNPIEFIRSDFSQPYTLINAQFTYNFKKLSVYGGCENIFDFRQRQPILSWQNPFSPYFDTSFVWGPTRGREFYVGLRWRLENL